MNAPTAFYSTRANLIIPFMSGFYDRFAEPFAWAAMRIAVGGMLVVEGWVKISHPLAQVGFVENIGFHPGWLWSPLLAGLQFFGGFLIAIGLFTRPLALANTIMLAITLWYHFAFPYGSEFLTPAGIEALKSGTTEYFTPAALARLKDGGEAFLETVQTKAELASLFWMGGTGLFAAFGGGAFSVDRTLLQKEF